MKGIIFNLFEVLVEADEGELAWDEILDRTGLSGVYTALGSYDDSELRALLVEVAKRRGLEADVVLRDFGRRALPMLAERYPEFVTPHESAVPFLLTLNDVIHAEVRKLYPGAKVPVFDFVTHDIATADAPPLALDMVYHSHRGMCALAEGFAIGVGEYFAQELVVEQSSCQARGDRDCVLSLRFSLPAPR